MASITRFFDHPDKWMNLLFLGLCMLIPVVGPIVAAGYCLVVITHELRRPGEMFPAFTFDHFVEYLKAGLWPFLVSLVVSVIATPLTVCTFCPAMLGPAFDSEVLAILGFCGSFILHLLAIVVIIAVMVPMMLRAGLAQNFGAGFDFAFIKDFLNRVWKELLLAMVVLVGFGIVAALVGTLACFVGLYAAMGVMTFVSWQLYAQLYNLYLERGGETIEMSPELLTLVEQEPDQPAGPETPPPPA